LPALDRRTTAALVAARTDDDAREAILGFVRAFHDGHFSPLSTLEPAPATPAPDPPPFVYSRSDPVGGCAAIGYGPDDPPAFSLPSASLAVFQPLGAGLTPPSRRGIPADAGGARMGIVRTPEFEESATGVLCQKEWNRPDIWGQNRLRRGVLRQITVREW